VLRDQGQAAALVEAITAYDRELALLTMPGGLIAALAAGAGLRVVREGFADRAYRPDGSLVPRGQPGAVRTDPAEVAAQAVALVTGSPVPAESICVHGDTPGAVELARAVRRGLEHAGLAVAPFA
jgi:UPF0271 protein